MAAPKKYPDELRERAVRLVRESGRPIAHVAEDLGIHREALRLWVRQDEADRGERDDRLTSDEREELKRLRAANAELRRANEMLKAASALFRQGTRPSPDEVAAVIDTYGERFGVEPICRVLEASPSTYYARRTRTPSPRGVRDQQLLAEIRRVHAANYGVYGARKVWKQLNREGIVVARCTVERLMRQAGITGLVRGAKRRTTIPDPAAPKPPDLVKRSFVATRPNQLWVSDITYVRTWEGWAYAALVTDVFSRRIAGWLLTSHLRTDLSLDALEMAVYQRRPGGELIHHSDRGSQYLSIRYAGRLAEIGAAASVGSVADSYDNALAESVNATFKEELIHRRAWRTRIDVEIEVATWVGWYNHHCIHRALGDIQPAEYEANHYASIKALAHGRS